MRGRTYDVKSFDLAEHFLQDYADRLDVIDRVTLAAKLAAHIQEAIEDWLADLDQGLSEQATSHGI